MDEDCFVNAQIQVLNPKSKECSKCSWPVYTEHKLCPNCHWILDKFKEELEERYVEIVRVQVEPTQDMEMRDNVARGNRAYGNPSHVREFARHYKKKATKAGFPSIYARAKAQLGLPPDSNGIPQDWFHSLKPEDQDWDYIAACDAEMEKPGVEVKMPLPKREAKFGGGNTRRVHLLNASHTKNSTPAHLHPGWAQMSQNIAKARTEENALKKAAISRTGIARGNPSAAASSDLNPRGQPKIEPNQPPQYDKNWSSSDERLYGNADSWVNKEEDDLWANWVAYDRDGTLVTKVPGSWQLERTRPGQDQGNPITASVTDLPLQVPAPVTFVIKPLPKEQTFQDWKAGAAKAIARNAAYPDSPPPKAGQTPLEAHIHAHEAKMGPKAHVGPIPAAKPKLAIPKYVQNPYHNRYAQAKAAPKAAPPKRAQWSSEWAEWEQAPTNWGPANWQQGWQRQTKARTNSNPPNWDPNWDPRSRDHDYR